jgi:hypothetical protein
MTSLRAKIRWLQRIPIGGGNEIQNPSVAGLVQPGLANKDRTVLVYVTGIAANSVLKVRRRGFRLIAKALNRAELVDVLILMSTPVSALTSYSAVHPTSLFHKRSRRLLYMTDLDYSIVRLHD